MAEAVVGLNALDQRDIDRVMNQLDGSANEGDFGANAILGVSLAVETAAEWSRIRSSAIWAARMPARFRFP